VGGDPLRLTDPKGLEGNFGSFMQDQYPNGGVSEPLHEDGVGMCRFICVYEIVSPGVGQLIEAGLGAAGGKLGGETAGQVVEHLGKKVNQVSAAINFGLCMKKCNDTYCEVPK
jgi:hypothetical protein